MIREVRSVVEEKAQEQRKNAPVSGVIREGCSVRLAGNGCCESCAGVRRGAGQRRQPMGALAFPGRGVREIVSRVVQFVCSESVDQPCPLFSSICRKSSNPAVVNQWQGNALCCWEGGKLFTSFCRNQSINHQPTTINPTACSLRFAKKRRFLRGGENIASAIESPNSLCIVRTPVSTQKPFFRR